jgi:succinate dehydrogenase / fumarate reductase membrane anchor subunit
MFKAFSGVLIIIVLCVHLIVNHLVAEGGLMTFADVIRYLSNPWIAFMEITVLILVVAHSFIGLRGIVLDLNPKKAVMKWVDWVLVITGAAAVIYGIGLIIIIT